MVDVKDRLAEIVSGRISTATAAAHYGLRLDNELFKIQFAAWAGRSRAFPGSGIKDGSVERAALEYYFHETGNQPIRVASHHFAMSPDAMVATLNALQERHLLIWRHEGLPEDLVPAQVIASFTSYFSDTQATIFSDHDDMCSQLHRSIMKELGIDIRALKDVTSTLMAGASDADYAYGIDVLSDEPIGIRYAVELKTKPLFLRPDAVSLVTWYRNKEALKNYLLTYEPRLPPGFVEKVAQ